MGNLNQKNIKPIIINATNIGSRSSGIGIYTLNILKEISRLRSRLPFLIYLNKTCYNEIQKLEFPENITLKWVSAKISPDNRFRGHFLRLLYANYLSIKHVKSFMIITSQLEACFFRSRQIITVHDIIPLLFKKFHKKQYFYFKYLLSFALKRARKIITPSNHTKQSLLKWYGLDGDKIQVIPNGARMPENGDLLWEFKLVEKYILYVGRICPMKNIVSLLKAFNQLKDKIPHKLVICGEGKEYLEKAVKSGELKNFEYENDQVVVLGYVSDQQIYNLYKNAALFIFPSFAEGFGLPPLESMKLGCPVIASNAESLPEVCGDAAYYINPSDVTQMAQGIYRILTNKKVRNTMIRKGYKRADLFSWQKSALAHLTLFDESLKSGSSKSPEMSHSFYSLPQISGKALTE